MTSKIHRPPWRRLRQILEGLIVGKTMNEISFELGLTRGALSPYLSIAKKMFNCRTTIELVVEYIKYKEIDEKRQTQFFEALCQTK